MNKAKEEDAKLSEGKEAHPFLLPRAFERIEVCSSRYSSYTSSPFPSFNFFLLLQSEESSSPKTLHVQLLRLPSFPDFPHVHQASEISLPPPSKPANGKISRGSSFVDDTEFLSSDENLDFRKPLALVPHFTEMLASLRGVS